MASAWTLACRIVGTATIVALLVAACTTAPNLLARRLAVSADIGPADAIVVLGASADRDGTLGDASLRRAVMGITLYRQGLAGRLVFLGLRAEPASRARLAASLGVDRNALILEGEEPTTRDEADRMRVVLRERLGMRTVLLVTDVLHMRRARGLFERAGLAVRPAPTELGILHAGTPQRRLQLTRAVGEELASLGYHKLFGDL